MRIDVIRLDDQVTHIAMVGKLDVAGLQGADVKFYGYTTARRRPTLADISGLDLITSLGMSLFISCARTLQRAGVRLVLLNPQPHVEEALKAVGIDQAIPIVRTVEEGLRILFPGSSSP